MTRATFVFVALALSLASGIATAQNYPVKPIRIVVPYPPGGGTDVVARTIAQKMNEMLGQPAVMDNRAGANGRTRAGSRAPACGM
jgi:tripartite-type tricarboxylate transporter receptor subunit TctC